MRSLACAGLVVAAFAAPAWGQDEQPDCQNAVTQLEMNVCAGLDHEEADEALNTVYGDLVAAMRATDTELNETSPDLVGAEAALKKAQRAWISYRDAHCETAGFQARGGSMEPMLVSSCMAELTRQRTAEIKALLGESQ